MTRRRGLAGRSPGRWLAAGLLGALLVGCAAPPTAGSSGSGATSGSTPYRCDRNGDFEQRRAC